MIILSHVELLDLWDIERKSFRQERFTLTENVRQLINQHLLTSKLWCQNRNPDCLSSLDTSPPSPEPQTARGCCWRTALISHWWHAPLLWKCRSMAHKVLCEKNDEGDDDEWISQRIKIFCLKWCFATTAANKTLSIRWFDKSISTQVEKNKRL